MESPYPDKFEILTQNALIQKPFFNASNYYRKNQAEFEQLEKKYRKEIDSGTTAKVDVMRSGVHGYGLFCCETLQKGDWIGQYTGEQRWALPFSQKTDYAWAIPAPTLPRLEINACRCGNALRFANHSFEPNAVADHLRYKENWIIIFYAAKRIEKGEEIFIDYGEKFWSSTQRELRVPTELFERLQNRAPASTKEYGEI